MLVAGLSDKRDNDGRLKVRAWTDTPAVATVTCRHAASLNPIATDVNPLPPPPIVADHPQLARSVFEIGGLPPDADVLLQAGPDEARIRTLPDANSELNLFLGSCYYAYRNNDSRSAHNGAISLAYDALLKKPHLKVLCGDQLYLDSRPLHKRGSRVEATFRRYRQYAEQYNGFLSKGLSVFSPDDHEFWNDYPRSMVWLSRSHRDKWKEHAQAAILANAAFQTITNPGGRNWFSLDLGLVDIFVTDLRSERSYGDRGRIFWNATTKAWGEEVTGNNRLCTPQQLNALTHWAENLQKPGLLVLNQPFFQDAGTAFDKNLLTFSNEAALIWKAVEGAPRSVAVLAGDIHWARANEWFVPGADQKKRLEIVASPLRLLKPRKILFITIGGRKKLKLDDLKPAKPPDGRTRNPIHGYATSTDNFTTITIRKIPTGLELTADTREANSSARTADDTFNPGVKCRRTFRLA